MYPQTLHLYFAIKEYLLSFCIYENYILKMYLFNYPFIITSNRKILHIFRIFFTKYSEFHM